MKLKSVPVKRPRDFKLRGAKARCSLLMDTDGIAHRRVELKRANPWNLESHIEIDVSDEIDVLVELKDWLKRAKDWMLVEDFEKDLKEWTRDSKRAVDVWDEVKVLSAHQLDLGQ